MQLGQSASVVGRSDTTSRIDHFVERVKSATNQIEILQGRLMRHARTLGFFDAPKTTTGLAPSPVIDNLESALTQLEREISALADSLSVFD